MGVNLCSTETATLPVGGLWEIRARVRTWDGYPADDVPVITVTKPDASTSVLTVATITVGHYRAEYVTAAAGRYTAAIATAGYGTVYAAAYAQAVTLAAAMPDADDVITYLGGAAETSWDSTEITAALAAEAEAQRVVCRVSGHYPADLREALLRRVQVNLARRAVPLGGQIAEAGVMRLPGRDPEVRRLEAPYRRTPVG